MFHVSRWTLTENYAGAMCRVPCTNVSTTAHPSIDTQHTVRCSGTAPHGMRWEAPHSLAAADDVTNSKLPSLHGLQGQYHSNKQQYRTCFVFFFHRALFAGNAKSLKWSTAGVPSTPSRTVGSSLCWSATTAAVQCRVVFRIGGALGRDARAAVAGIFGNKSRVVVEKRSTE